jgi:hypothetical protein
VPTIAPLMLSARDEELLGTANRSDPMGALAVWSVRGRDLVPHLTEQTTNVRGFQVLVEAFRLWEVYEAAHPAHAGRIDDFVLIVEQTFARIVGWHTKEWGLPGRRRVVARAWDPPHVSLQDHAWHLLGGQKANGIWGLYRGAARRAGLLDDDMRRLSLQTSVESTMHSLMSASAITRLMELAASAMEGSTVPLPTHGNHSLVRGVLDTFQQVPLADHLHARLIDSHPLNRALAARLLEVEELNHRALLVDAAATLPEHAAALADVIRCEDLLAGLEAVFLWLCASKGGTVEVAVKDLPVDLAAFARARVGFAESGTYGDHTAAARHDRMRDGLDPSSKVTLARSVLELHAQVSKERRRAPWIWEDGGILHSDVEVTRPSEDQLRVGVAWRNDYYLLPLLSVARQLAEVRA